jgi:glucokinase
LNPFAEKDVACSIAVIAAGTVLGEANLIWDGGRYHIIAMEGGQADIAPKEVPTKAF